MNSMTPIIDMTAGDLATVIMTGVLSAVALVAAIVALIYLANYLIKLDNENRHLKKVLNYEKKNKEDSAKK